MSIAFALTGLVAAVALAGAAYTAEQPKASKATYLRLMEVQEYLEVENYDRAFAELDQALVKAAGKPFDIATIQQYIAHTAILAGRDRRARPALEAALRQPGLPVTFIADLKLFLGQLVIGDEEYQKGVELLEYWIANTDSRPQPTNLFSLAYAYYMTGNMPGAERYAERAINESPGPSDSWYQIYYQALFEQKKYARALGVLHGLINRDPGQARYWRMLANHHMQIEDGKKALAAMAIAYDNDMLTDSVDLMRVASLYGYVDVPEKSARLLEQWIAEGKIEQDGEMLRKLGDLWMLAREREKAKGYLRRAATTSRDPKTFELLASLHFEDEQWRNAYSYFAAMLELNGRRDAEGNIIRLEDPLRVHMLAGISAFRAGMNAEARHNLTRALEHRRFRDQARALLAQLD